MHTDILNNLSDLLNEEQWTRATINSYKVRNFEDLIKIIREAKKIGILENVRNLCSEHLKHTQNSIIAQYILGKLNYEDGILEDQHIVELITIFIYNKKFNIVEFLSRDILKYGENKDALNALAQCLEKDKREKELISVWERLVKIDYDETHLVKKLATIKEERGNIEEAVNYYKKALWRFIKKRIYSQIEEIWIKLIELVPEDLDFYLNTEKRITKVIGRERTASLLSFILPYYIEKDEFDTAIDLLKQILAYDSNNKKAQKEIIECYCEKYKKHSKLNEYLETSGLLKINADDIHTAINKFEKHIVFDVENYVYHRKWGIGKCKKIEGDSLIIDFTGKPNHSMKLQMAFSSLQKLPNDHILLRKEKNLNELKEKILNDAEEGLKIIIKSYGNRATLEDIKSELINGVFTKSEWNRWWNNAKITLKKNPNFGTMSGKNNVYFIRKQPLSFDEDIFNRFKEEKDFDKKLKLFHEFTTNGEIDSEYFTEMLNYFKGFISSTINMNENTLKSFLLLKNLKKSQPYIPIEFSFNFNDILENIDEIYTMFPLIQESELKKSFLFNIKNTMKNWPDIFSKCFYEYPMIFIIDELSESGLNNIAEKNINNILVHYRELRDLFLWVCKNLIVKRTDLKVNIDLDQSVMGLIHLLEISNRELINEKNVVSNRKLFNTVVNILFKNNLLVEYIQSSDESKVKRIIPTIFKIDDIKDEYIVKARVTIKKSHPNIVFEDEIESFDNTEQLVVTQRSYELRQKELKYLNEEEIPSISKEIGTAIKKGALRENAEYKIALERQELLKQRIKALSGDLKRVKVLNPDKIDTDMVSIGTKVAVISVDGTKTEKFTILGPWESEPSEKIISYTSPVGKVLMNKALGDVIDLSMKDNKKLYKILKIEKAVFK